jgi:hypothetical protein
MYKQLFTIEENTNSQKFTGINDSSLKMLKLAEIKIVHATNLNNAKIAQVVKKGKHNKSRSNNQT